MPRYLISFVMRTRWTTFPTRTLPAVDQRLAHAVVQEAINAGVLVFGGGLAENE